MRVSQVHDLQRLDDTLGYQIGASINLLEHAFSCQVQSKIDVEKRLRRGVKRDFNLKRQYLSLGVGLYSLTVYSTLVNLPYVFISMPVSMKKKLDKIRRNSAGWKQGKEDLSLGEVEHGDAGET